MTQRIVLISATAALLTLVGCGSEGRGTPAADNAPVAPTTGDPAASIGIAEPPSEGLPVAGQGSTDDGAVSLGVPAQCEADADCGPEGSCISEEPGAPGHCDVDESVANGGAPISNAAPAICSNDADCPAGVSCVALLEGGPKLCDIEEMAAQ